MPNCRHITFRRWTQKSQEVRGVWRRERYDNALCVEWSYHDVLASVQNANTVATFIFVICNYIPKWYRSSRWIKGRSKKLNKQKTKQKTNITTATKTEQLLGNKKYWTHIPTSHPSPPQPHPTSQHSPPQPVHFFILNLLYREGPT